ncbi:hypothetical protein [Pseudonocardia xishanensis]|uniref:SH3 domain-containing protein n=1 Tax=Pseudonocardia xishanensis TaxID=630995 RepID=A0ABP8S1N6_9PSEU
MTRKTLVAGGVAALLVTLFTIVTAGTATAAEAAATKGVITRDSHSFSAPTVYSPPVSALKKDQVVETLCFLEGQRHPGDGSIYWFRIRDDNGSSFVPRIALKPPTDIRQCPIP